MTINLPFEVLAILDYLTQKKFPAYLVGGAVRDILLGQPATKIKDFDFTTAAEPEKLLTLFPNSFYENEFGTVSIPETHLLNLLQTTWQLPVKNLALSVAQAQKEVGKKQKIIDLLAAKKIHRSLSATQTPQNEETNNDFVLPPFEITTFRSDGIYHDHRRPETVTWGKTISDDLQRRDFTINALAIEISPAFLQAVFNQKTLASNYQLTTTDYQLIDLHDGLKDLSRKEIRTVGDPDQRFQEDALRMLRAVRLSVELNFKIEKNTYVAIKSNAGLLQYISAERIRDEFLRILVSPNVAVGMQLLTDLGLLNYILPELEAGRGMKQSGHHVSDVLQHSLDALANCPSRDPIVRLATLLHDIGKPATYQDLGNKVTFYNHEIIGSRLASKIAQRLRLSKNDTQRVFTLVRYHMFHYQETMTDAAVRRFMRRVGLENIDDILDVREADRLGSGAKKTSWRLEEMKERVIEQLNQPMDLTDLAVNGDDLMRALALQPGPILGEILHSLLEIVLEEPELNQKEILLQKATEMQNNFAREK